MGGIWWIEKGGGDPPLPLPKGRGKSFHAVLDDRRGGVAKETLRISLPERVCGRRECAAGDGGWRR